MRDTVVSGSLRATDSLLTTTLQTQILNIPTTSNGTTYGPGTSGNVISSNGTSVYWRGVTDNSSSTAVTSTDTNLITGRTLYYAGYVKSSGVTSITIKTTAPLTGGSNTATTGTGTYTIALSNQNANIVLAGPSSGSAAAPSFRALVAADIPKATTSAVGGISVSTGLSVTAAGALSVSYGTAASTALQGNQTLFKLNNADKTASSAASFYAPTAGGTAGNVLIGAGTTTAPSWYTGLSLTGAAAASYIAAFAGTTDASASNSAAVTIAGGLGVAKKLYVGTGIYTGAISIGGSATASDVAARTIATSTTNLLFNTPDSYGFIFKSAGTAKCRIVADTFYPETNANGSIGITGQRWKYGYFSTNIYIGSTSYTAYNSNAKGVYLAPACTIVATNAANVSGEGFALIGHGAQYARMYIQALGTANSGNNNATLGEIGKAYLVVGNNTARPASGTAGGGDNAEGVIYLYSSSSRAHIIKGAATSSNYTHYFPKQDSWIASGGDGTSTGVGSATEPVYLKNNGIITKCTSIIISIAKGTEDHFIARASGYTGSKNLDVKLMVGSGKINHGIYSTGYSTDGTAFTADAKWMIYRNGDGTVIVNGNCTGSSGSCTGNAATATALKMTADDMSATAVTSALQTFWNANKTTMTKDKIIAFASKHSGKALHIGYFISGYDNTPYGGFFTAFYGTPYYSSASNGTFACSELVKADSRTYSISVSGNAASLNLTRVTETANHLPSKNNFIVREYNSSSANLPSADWYHVYEGRGSDNAYGTQLAVGMTTQKLYYRNYSSSAWNTWKQVWISGDSVTGAVWNDYAEYRTSTCNEPGYCVFENGDDTLSKTTTRLQHFAGITSDTWGFAQGETETAKTPIAVSGRVLAYTYKDRNEYKPGDCVCTAPDGTVDIMTKDEIMLHPDKIVGTVSCVPKYEEWGGGTDRSPVKVNGRIWIKVR